MAHEVETMAYTGQTPWHGLGNKVEGIADPMQMLEVAGLDWTVEKRDLEHVATINEKTHRVKVPNHFALVRSSDDSTLSIVGPNYIPVQNEAAMRFFKKFTDAGSMVMETAGSLRDGKLIWALARLNSSFDAGPDDRVDGYLLLSQPHIIGQGMTIKHTDVRVVCNNTLVRALNESTNGGSFRMPHVREFDDRVAKQAEEALGIGIAMTQQFKDEAVFMASKQITEESAREFMVRVFDPKKAKADKSAAANDDDSDDKRIIGKAMEALVSQPGADLVTSKGTAWGAFNAVTFLIDHQLGRTQDGRVYNALFGNNASVKQRAKALAIEYAKAA